jgi:hypothetical protein
MDLNKFAGLNVTEEQLMNSLYEAVEETPVGTLEDFLKLPVTESYKKYQDAKGNSDRVTEIITAVEVDLSGTIVYNDEQ